MASAVATPAQIEVTDKQHKTRRLLQTMAKHVEILCLLFAVIFTIISKYSRSGGGATRIYMSQPAPRLFFSQSTTILDFPYGNLEDVADLLNEEEIIAVMYYAPWCSRSHRARAQFDKASKWFAGEVLFIGVNCWYPLGMCRKQNNFVSFPVIYIYCKGRDGYRYSGPVQADRLVIFMQRLLYPLERIVNIQQYQQFVSTHDTAVVGYFDFHSSPQPPGYNQFYLSAQRVIERDQKNTVPFGVITTAQLARYAKLNETHHMLMSRLNNVTMFYPETANFTSSAISQWVMNNRSMSHCKWHLPSEIKSSSLAKEINNNPTLLLFTPYKPMAATSPYFMTLRETSIDYYNCDNSTSVHATIDTSRKSLISDLLEQQDLQEECRNLFGKKKTTIKDKPQHQPTKCCSTISTRSADTQNRGTCDICVSHQTLLSKFHGPSTSCDQLNMLPMIGSASIQLQFTRKCTEAQFYYNPWEHMTLCCDNSHPFQGSRSKFEAFTGSDQSVTSGPTRTKTGPSKSLKLKCQKLRKLKMNGWTLGESLGLHHFGSREPATIARAKNFTGLGCRTNRTFNFLAMDSKHSYSFAERLGVSLGASLNKTVAVIFDKKNEATYVLNRTVDKDALVTFIQNYTSSLLSAKRRSVNVPRVMCDRHYSDVCIYEVTTHTLHALVMDIHKDVVLLHYAPYCGFCTTLAHAYLTLAKYFRSAADIRFARINGDANDLPWNMQSYSYPTIQLFPAYRKSDSVVFPEHLEKTLPNLVQFVLQHSAKPLRLQTGLSI